MVPEARTFAELRAADVLAAAHRLRGVVTRTALRRSPALSERAGADVWLKLETEQPTGSFKVRGAFNALASLGDDVRARGVVASSAGNHGLGVAWAARRFGIPARIFIPGTAPEVKRRGIDALGAIIDRAAPHYDAALGRARAYAAEHGLAFINPCAGDALVAGQGRVARQARLAGDAYCRRAEREHRGHGAVPRRGRDRLHREPADARRWAGGRRR
jgi:threonine dehydratase